MDAMLWYSFLRTGDLATFRLARAMTQHISEADVHHAGRFAGLGSRHDVVHRGDTKEARVSESFTKRFGWQQFLSDPAGQPWPATVRITGDAVPEPVDEIPVTAVADDTVATNDAAQRGLAIIALLAVAPNEGP